MFGINRVSYIQDGVEETSDTFHNTRPSTKPISPDKGLGRLTRLEAMQDKSVNEAALERLKDEEIKLQNALTKILARYHPSDLVSPKNKIPQGPQQKKWCGVPFTCLQTP